jgi:cytochrome b subunit of formate dehydrogenase
MKHKAIITSILTTSVIGIGGLILAAFNLNFAGIFKDYTLEAIVLIGFTLALISIVSFEIYSYKALKMKEKVKLLEAECQSYKKYAEELQEIDIEGKQLRSIIKFKNNI